MDPLSIITGVGGLIQLSIELHSTLTDYIDRHKEVPRYLRLVLAEITALKAIFRQLQEFIDAADTMDESRKSLVNTADLVTVLTGCVCIYSLLEKQVLSGHANNDLKILEACVRTRRAKAYSFEDETNISTFSSLVANWKVARRWVDRTPLFVAILDDLRAHKDNLNLLLTVMNCTTSSQALQLAQDLKLAVNNLRQNPGDVSRRTNELMYRGEHPADATENCQEARDTVSALSRRSIRSVVSSFEKVLRSSRPYKSKLVWNDGASLASSQFKHTRWTTMSDLSLSEISHIAVIDLPIYPVDLWSYGAYDGRSSEVSQKSFLNAAREGDYDTVVHQIEEGCNIESRDPIGATALLNASNNGHTKIVKYLLERGANPNTTYPGTSTTPLAVAATCGNEELVKALVEGGADVNLFNGRALYSAAERNWESVVRLLISYGSKVNYQDPSTGMTPLHEAAGRGNASMVQLLLESGANVKARTKITMTSPRRLAAKAGHHQIVEMLR